MRKSERFIARVLVSLAAYFWMVLILLIGKSPTFRHLGDYGLYVCVALFLAILGFGGQHIFRDNLSRGKRLLRRGRVDEAIAEFELGAENEHVGATIALGDMLLFGYKCRANPDRAVDLYRHAFECMIWHEATGLQTFWYWSKAPLPEPSSLDSNTPSVNRKRLQNMAHNLVGAGDISDPAVQDLLQRIYDKLGHVVRPLGTVASYRR